MITAIHLRWNGDSEEFRYDPRDNGLAALQERVGGWIEAAPCGLRDITMYCNEEGKVHDLPYNGVATGLLDPACGDWIAGDVVLVGGPDGEGYDTTLPPDFIERWWALYDE